MLNEYRDKIIEWIKNGRTASEISKEFGTSRTYPYNLAKRLNLPLKSNSNKKIISRMPLTQLHAALGEKLAWERNFRAKKPLAFVAAEIGITSTKLNQIERGTIDLTLLDLIKIADYYGVNVWMILKTATEAQFEETSAFKI